MKLKKIVGLFLATIILSASFSSIVRTQNIGELEKDCQEKICNKTDEEKNKEANTVSNLDKALQYIMETQTIKSDKITLTKKFEKEDKESLANLFLDKEVHEHFFLPMVVDFGSTENILEQWKNIDKNESPSKLRFVIKNPEGVPVGILEFNYLKEDNEIWLGVWIGKPFWGNRYASEAMVALISEMCEFKPKVTFSLSLEEHNEKSKKFIQKVLRDLNQIGISYFLEGNCSDVRIEIIPIIEDNNNMMIEIFYKSEIIKIPAPKNKIKYHIFKDNKYEVKLLEFKINLS